MIRPPTAGFSGFTNGWVRAMLGGLVWVAAVLVILPNPFEASWAKVLLLLAPLVLVPFGVDVAAGGTATAGPDRLWQVTMHLQLPAALLLASSFLLSQGVLAASLAVPWLLTTGVMAWCGLWRVWRRGLKPLADLCLDAGVIFVVVGGAWAVADRLGFRPLDFDPVIVLLTAIHFHYAGFTLPIITGCAVRQVPGWIATCAGVGVLAGVPLVAIGITATQLHLGSVIECIAAWVMAFSGMLVAWLHFRLALQAGWPKVIRSLWAISGLSLMGSMVLAALYGTRFYAPIPWLDISWMRMLHGTANAFGFGLVGLLAWKLVQCLPKPTRVSA